MKEYKAIVTSVSTVNELMEATFDVDGEVVRYGDTLSYHIRFKNRTDIERFQEQMFKDGITIDSYSNSTTIPEDAAKELLAKKLAIGNIRRLFVEGDDQIILYE